MRLYDWDGKALAEVATLEGSKGVVSALAFSPDGALLTAGDVSVLLPLADSPTLTISQSSGKIILYNVKERKVSLPLLPQPLTHR